MSERRSRGKRQAGGTLPSETMERPSSDIVTVPYVDEAPYVERPREIHPRRIIPTVPEGPDEPDASPTPALALDQGPDGFGPLALTDDLTLVRNVELGSVADNNVASDVGEPSLATNGDVVFYTGNWYAAVSIDGGATFRYVNPYTAFPDPSGMRFCCDQVVHYIRSIDTFVWLLQYSQNAAGANIQRLAFATTDDVRQGRWRTFDLTPDSLGFPGLFLDFPDLAVGRNMLYVTTNGFTGQNWSATFLVRLPLAGIASGNVTAQHTMSQNNFNFRVAQHCGTTAYWASHNSTSSLRVFAWPESAAQPSFTDTPVASWSRTLPYQSLTPDNINWLGRADYRIVGATKAGNNLWFAWAANKGGANNRPQPYVQIARVSATTMNVLENINLWDAQAAICYAALATNSANEVGVAYAIGGGTRHPSLAIGMLTGTPRHVVAIEGSRSPQRGRWGDYFTTRRHYPNQRLFASAGYTFQQGPGPQDGAPRFVLFGRSGEV